MISSMTGFGRATVQREGREITVELKSVNHRYLDLAFRMPRHIGFIEDVFRSGLSDRLARGHVDVFVNYKNTRNDSRRVEVDDVLLGEYLAAARKAGELFSLKDDITLAAALRLPDVTDVVEADEDREAVCALAEEALKGACDELTAMREREGERLRGDLSVRVETTQRIRDEIALRAPQVVLDYRDKLNERITALLNDVKLDETRLATEVALFADKASIDEELVRINSHLIQFSQALSGSEPAGRKLDFIVQELNREFNTIGSKANDAGITNLVISGKGEIEKIREQVQNIE